MNSFHEGYILVWTKGIIEVGFDAVGNSRVWACCTHMKALFLTVVLTAALFIAALKYWHVWSTEMSEFYSRERNQNRDSVGMGAWGHRSCYTTNTIIRGKWVCFSKACLCFSIGNWELKVLVQILKRIQCKYEGIGLLYIVNSSCHVMWAF